MPGPGFDPANVNHQLAVFHKSFEQQQGDEDGGGGKKYDNVSLYTFLGASPEPTVSPGERHGVPIHCDGAGA